MLGKIHATVGFFGARGITIEQGLTEANLQEADVKRRMLDRCQEVIVVADSSKFGQVTLAPFGELACVQRLVTDTDAPREMLQRIGELGVDIMVV